MNSPDKNRLGMVLFWLNENHETKKKEGKLHVPEKEILSIYHDQE